MQIFFNLIDKPIPAIILGIRHPGGLNLSSHTINNNFLFVHRIQLSNFSRTEQIININQKPLISNLSLSKQKQNPLFSGPGPVIQSLQVVFEVAHVISGGNRDLVGGIAHNVRRKLRKRLFSGAPDADQQSVPRRRQNYSANSAHVF